VSRSDDWRAISSSTIGRAVIILLGAAVVVAAGWSVGQPRRPAAAAPAASRPFIDVVDDVGRPVRLPRPLERVVVFNRYTTEFIRAIAGMDVVVGFDVDMTRMGSYWPDARAVTVGRTTGAPPDYEAIVATRPDVVFFARNGPWEQASRVLAPFHIPVFVLTGWDVLKHEWNVTLLGELFGHPTRAAELNAFYARYRDLLRERLADVTPRRVYLEEVPDYRTLLPGSGWHDMIELGGGTNVYGDVRLLDGPSPRGTVQGFEVDPETVVDRRPDVIIKLHANHRIAIDLSEAHQTLNALVTRPGFDRTPAAARGEVYVLSYYLAGAASKVVGALQIAEWLHPDRMAGLDADEAMREWLERFQGVRAPGGYTARLDRRQP